MPSLITIFREMPDPRRGNTQRHDLLDILTIALVASVCGAESCVDFAEFACDREVLLREFLRLENGLPSHGIFSRVFRLLDPEAFARAVRAHWAIENSLHWVLDVTFDEDHARNRRDNGPENLAILRRLTLNLLNTARPNLPVSRKRKRAGWSDAFARTIIGQMR